MLTNYLMRTFRKRDFSEDEVNIAHTVQNILSQPVEPNKALQSYLAGFMTFDETPVINYVKLFLLYAQTTEEFKKIAQFLIASKRHLQFATIQDVEHDTVLERIKNLVKGKKKYEDRVKIITEELRKQYLKLFKVSGVKVAAQVISGKGDKVVNLGKLAQLQEETSKKIGKEEQQKNIQDSIYNNKDKVDYKNVIVRK